MFAHVVVAPDGRHAYVANGGENTVSVVDISAQRVVETIGVGASPHGMRFSPDAKQAWVANLEGGTVSVIDTQTRKQIARIAVGKSPAQVGFTPVSFIDLGTFKVVATIETGPGAHGVVIDRDGRRAFVTNTYANSVSVIDVAERKVIATVPVGKGPNGISITP